jgi:eukaryotic-like serine/threonine-protein kinase
MELELPPTLLRVARPRSTHARHLRLMELFDDVCELPRDEQGAWLDRLQASDVPLRPQLEAMLDVDGGSRVFQTCQGAELLAREMLESSLRNSPRMPTADSPIPLVIGEFEVIEAIGAGGMGSVYRARQREPERIVALKTLHPWLVSPASIERFRLEAQALASITHPFIPPVFAVGTHEGVVYFVMEFVEGATLTDWVEDRGLAVRGRIELLAQICEAVHHAHLRGFVHRDLKPDNLRVTADGTPRVLDFGIAACLSQRRAEVAGTPAYMSPEQLDPAAPVDVRSDVFALGVILFELLTGRLPVTPVQEGLAALQAKKREPAPRLKTVAPALGAELDAIVARSLEPDPARRYASAAELGDDLRRMLRCRPVLAMGGGGLYRAGRFVRRNRVLAAALGALAISLGGGAAVSLALFVKAQRAATQAQADADRANTALAFLTNVLTEANGDFAGGREATIGQALDNATRRLAAEPLEPVVEVQLRSSLADTYIGLGDWIHAKEQALAALAPYEDGRVVDDERYAAALLALSDVYVETGEARASGKAAERALAIERRIHGTSPHRHVADSLHNSAVARRGAHDFAGAEALHRLAVAMERDLLAETGAYDDVCVALGQYGLTLAIWGRFEDSQRLLDEATAISVRLYGAGHQRHMSMLSNVAWLAYNRGDLDAARALLTEIIRVRATALDVDHMRTGLSHCHLGTVEVRAGNIDAAEREMTEGLRVARSNLGADSPRYASLEVRWVEILLARGRVEEAQRLSAIDLERIEQWYGPHTYTIDAMVVRSKALEAAGRLDEALELARRAVKDAIAVFGPGLYPMPRRLADAQLSRLEDGARGGAASSENEYRGRINSVE